MSFLGTQSSHGRRIILFIFEYKGCRILFADGSVLQICLPILRSIFPYDSVVWLCVLPQMMLSSVAPSSLTLSPATFYELYKDISHGRAVDSSSVHLLLGVIRPVAHNWREKDPADLHTRQTTSPRLEIPAGHH